MVKAMINIQDRTNRVLNVIKAKHGLKDKSAAIDKVVGEYEQQFLDIRLHPEYQKKSVTRKPKDHIDKLKEYIEK